MSYSPLLSGQPYRVNTHTVSWVSDDNGDYAETFGPVNGVILRVVTDPAAGGDAPADNYDLTIADANGFDVLAGQGANRDTADAESFCPLIPAGDGATVTAVPVAVSGLLTLRVDNAGAVKRGSVVLYLG